MQAKILLDLFLLSYGLFSVFAAIICTIYIFTGKIFLVKGVTTRGAISEKRKKFIRVLGTILCVVGVVACVSEAIASAKDIPYVITDSALEAKGRVTYVDDANWHIGIGYAKIRDELTGVTVRIRFFQSVFHTGDYVEAIYYPNTKLSIITGHILKTD